MEFLRVYVMYKCESVSSLVLVFPVAIFKIIKKKPNNEYADIITGDLFVFCPAL